VRKVPPASGRARRRVGSVVVTQLGKAWLVALDQDDLAGLALLLAPFLQTASDRPQASPLMLTCSQVALRAGAHVETVRRAWRSGALHASGKVGRSPRFTPADVDSWLSSPRELNAPRRSGRRLADQPRPVHHRPLKDALKGYV
jgi:hypothetical protein